VFTSRKDLFRTIICGVSSIKNFGFTSIKTGYRKDIVGLRAIACLFVIFNHFKVPGFTGGFIGVDIFLVISGYLITGMLIRITENDQTTRKNILQQYLIFLIKRSLRIFPAAFGVIILVLIGSQFFLNSFENKNNRIDGFLNSLMVGNLYFADLGTNYFQSNRAESYFLHYWSLSVEWQFYLIYGLFFLLFLRKLNSKYFLMVTNLFLITASLIYFWINNESSQIYFSAFARAWELLLGSQIFLFSAFASKRQKIRINFDFVIFSMLVVSVFLVNDKTWYFGVFLAVMVVALLLSNVFDLVFVRIFLDLRFLQHLGKISYSLYLVHWPVWLFLNHSISLGPIKRTICALFLTYTLSIVIFYVFEKPFLVSHPRRQRLWNLTLLKDFSSLKILIFPILFIQILSISSAVVKPAILFKDVLASPTSKGINPVLSRMDFHSRTCQNLWILRFPIWIRRVI